MEKGHPLAALGAAWVNLPSPYIVAPPSMAQPQYDSRGMPSGAPGMPAGGSGGVAWGGYRAMGNRGDGGEMVGSPKGYRGLDGVGQALSAALQVNDQSYLCI